ncbi:hypothetical protein [Photorhabdus sp. RM71S]|uniref:hypothetical protein n=1 Tax=Photorhabdus sp. RM71S TaxID=3342824 RepID=UPI0036DBFE4F
MRGAVEEIRRSTRERREVERSNESTELGGLDELQSGEGREPEVISSSSDSEEHDTSKRDKRKIILD